MMPINVDVEKIRSYFASMSVTVSSDWLTGCIEYFREEKPQCSLKELQEFVWKQWELSDLRNSAEGNLPENLQSQIKVTLRGKYAVQIESVIDVSQPAYNQLLKIRKVDVGNVEATEKKPETWEPRSTRMLKIKVCDGKQLVDGIEYRPLPFLNNQVTPGTKVLIIGPVDCRRGVFFLKPENIKILGGEVDSLLIVNHTENVLARTLGVEENPNPVNVVDISQNSTIVSDTQGSTYTPANVQTSASAANNAGRTVSNFNTTRNPSQHRPIHEFFKHESQVQHQQQQQQQPLQSQQRQQQRQPQRQQQQLQKLQQQGLEDLNEEFLSDFAIDDMFADGDEIFMDIPEVKEVEEIYSESTPVISNSIHPKQTTNSFATTHTSNYSYKSSCRNFSSNNKPSINGSISASNSGSNNLTTQTRSGGGNVTSEDGKKSSFKIPEGFSSRKSAQNHAQSSKTNENPFLASDEYIDSFDFEEWEDEELNNFSNASSKANLVKDTKQSNFPVSTRRTESFPSPTNQPNRSIASSSKCPERAPEILQSHQQLHSERSLPGTQISGFHSNLECSSTNRYDKEMNKIHQPQKSFRNINSEQGSSNFMWDSNFKKPPAEKLFKEKSVSPSTFNQQQQKEDSLGLLNEPAFEAEQDWADVYLSSQNSNFMRKNNKSNISNVANSPLNISKAPPSSNTSKRLDLSNQSILSDSSVKTDTIEKVPKSPVFGSKNMFPVPGECSSKPHFSNLISKSRESLEAIKTNSVCQNSSTSEEYCIPAGPSKVQFPEANVKLGTPSTSRSHTKCYDTSAMTLEGSSKGYGTLTDSKTQLQPAISSPSYLSEETKITSKPDQYSAHIETLRKPSSSTSPKTSSVRLRSENEESLSSPNRIKNIVLKTPSPFVYLINILQSPSKMNGIHRIKATIITLLSHLKIDDNSEWTLSAKICDGTGTLDVQFSAEVLDELIGLSALEFRKMKKDVPKNPLLKDTLVKILEKSRVALINLNCLFDIKIEAEKIAQVVKLTELTAQDVNKLKLRLENS